MESWFKPVLDSDLFKDFSANGMLPSRNQSYPKLRGGERVVVEMKRPRDSSAARWAEVRPGTVLKRIHLDSLKPSLAPEVGAFESAPTKDGWIPLPDFEPQRPPTDHGYIELRLGR
jgi:hypothetical protein